MQKRIKEKMLRVLDLVLTLNPEETDREITGEKPTVFVNFSGHVGLFETHIHSQGWGDTPYDNPDYSWKFYLTENPEIIENRLDRIIEILGSYVERWCENG